MGFLIVRAAVQSRSVWLTAGLVWLTAFAFGSLQGTASNYSKLSQLLVGSYLLTVLITSQSAHRVLGNRGQALRTLISLAPNAGTEWTILGPAVLATLVVVSTMVANQLSPCRVSLLELQRVTLPAVAALAIAMSVSLWTIVFHLWLEPAFALPVALGFLILALAFGGSAQILVDPWIAVAAARGTASAATISLHCALGITLPLSLSRATVARWEPRGRALVSRSSAPRNS